MKKLVSLLAAVVMLSFVNVAVADTLCLGVGDGSQETPPVDSAGSSVIVLTLNADQSALTMSAWVTNLDGITMSHIHRGAAMVSGPVIFGIGADYSTQPQVRVWDESSSPPLGPTDVTDLLSGNLYYNVHTSANPGGEVRGQIYCF